MLCYQDSTFCTGGKPLCAKFSTCPKALTDEHKAKAKERRLPINIYVSANSMPCHTTVAQEEPKKPRRDRTKTGRRRTFKLSEVDDKVWRSYFDANPPVSTRVIAQELGCSHTTVQLVRKNMGYAPLAKFGWGDSRPLKYTHEDAEKVARIRKPDEPLQTAARRAGYSRIAAQHLCRRFREYFEAVR
jgi:hypothetical protein